MHGAPERVRELGEIELSTTGDETLPSGRTVTLVQWLLMGRAMRNTTILESITTSLEDVTGGYVPTYARGRWTGTPTRVPSRLVYGGDSEAQRAGFKNMQRYEYYQYINNKR
jgi:hypothetical protein